ncbi:alpha/beta fold hydrolase [Micromonospora sp. M12]
MRDDCRTQSGPLFDHIDSASVARDTDAIRAALGERQLSFYEWSYGTLIGQAYAELFPSRVRALAMDSVMDHSQGSGTTSAAGRPATRPCSASSWPGAGGHRAAHCTDVTYRRCSTD